MENYRLPIEYEFFLNYPIIGRLKPVIVLEEAISKLGKITSENYVDFRYLQLELIVKQCDLLSDIAVYITATKKFIPKQSYAENHEIFMEVYRSFVNSEGTDVHDFYANLNSKTDQFFYDIMGYDLFKLLHPDIERRENKEELENSVNSVKSIFQEMASFQPHFWGVYNAYKHGFRLFVDKAKSEMICSEGVCGDLESFIMDSIIFIDRKGKKIPAIFFNRGQVMYHHSFFYLIQGIINAFNIRLVTSFGGF